MQPKHSKYVIWLLPDRFTKGKLQDCINHFSSQFSSPSFYPHITLGKVPQKSDLELKQIFSDLSRAQNTFSVSLSDPVCGKAPFQRFTAPIENYDTLLMLSDNLDNISGGLFGKKTDFHVSLYYGSANCEELHRNYKAYHSTTSNQLYVQFIALVNVSGDVQNWEIKYQEELNFVNH